MGKNNLKIFPESVAELQTLESLIIDENPLKKIPEFILEMKSLKSIQIDNEQAKNSEDIIRKMKTNGVGIYIVNKKNYLWN